MKKGYSLVLMGLFLFFGCFFAVNASGSGAKNSSVGKSSAVRSTRAVVGSLPIPLQSVVSATLGADNPGYRVSRSGNGYRAVNGRNGLTATIDLEQFTVRAGSNEWGLRLTAWGRGPSLQRIGTGRILSRPGRVDIDRDGIVEWWINGPLGIEQGWTVANRPHESGSGGKLTLVLKQSGNLRARTLPRGGSLVVSNNSGREVLRYTGLTAYDKNGKQLPARFEATGKTVRVIVDDTNAAYPVLIDPWVQVAMLTVSEDRTYNGFGSSVAVSSDGTIVVVGAPNAKVGNNADQGEVYVFKEWASGWPNWTQVAKLTASDGGEIALLGTAVAVSSDGATVVAGAPRAIGGGVHGADDVVVHGGAVYVFKEPASGWANENETARLTASEGGEYSTLGLAVAVSSDGATIVAEGNSATDPQGAVYVFKEPASGWANATQTAELTASDGTANDFLGGSVAVSADGATIVAGDLPSFYPRGAVLYLFKEPTSGWANVTQTAKLTASHGVAGDELGLCSVKMSSDGKTVVAAAPAATIGGNGEQGAVYVFKEPASGWANATQTAELTASDGVYANALGHSVALAPDGKTIVTGARGSGLYVFKEPDSGWANGTEAAKINVLAGVAQVGFGEPIAVSSDGATVVAGNLGSVGVFQATMDSLWQNAAATGNGWYYLSPFGSFHPTSSSWIYHQTLGWLYPFGTSTESIWFYDPQWDGTGGWWWTSASVFPWLYSVTENEWLYFDAWNSAPGARWFYTTTGRFHSP